MSLFPLAIAVHAARVVMDCSVALPPLLAHAQAATPIKFQLDWRFEGPAALFLASGAKEIIRCREQRLINQ